MDQNQNTYTHLYNGWETVVGDEKQADFYPRVKIKKWNNEVNFSVGLKDLNGSHSVENDKIIYKTATQEAHFYPINSSKPFDNSKIRYIQTGKIDPVTIAAQYELDRHVHWPMQTIVYHIPDRYSMMYYGNYPVSKYIESIDIPETRVSGTMNNNPMIMDEGLPLIDVHYNPQRDSMTKIDSSMKQAINEIVGNYVTISKEAGGKLYFKDGEKDVKFFSTAFISGHYYFYINLNTDYNKAYDYYMPSVRKDIRDEYAYGLKSLNPDIPDSLVDDVIKRYSEIYGIRLVEDNYTEEEKQIIDNLKPIMASENWIKNAKRDDIWNHSAIDEFDGYEFEVKLKEKPETNVISLSVQTKGLDFYYQPDLDNGDIRPSNVVGSFAVYHKTQRHNQYKTGKAFHMYRPWAVDATGNKVWCDYDATWNGEGDLNLTIPQDFIENAKYPILVDPTFGYTTAGGTSAILLSTYNYVALLDKTATLGSLNYYVWYGSIAATSSNSVSFEMGSYFNSTGTLADGTASTTVTANTTLGWNTIPSNIQVLATSDVFDIGFFVNVPTPASYYGVTVYYDTGASGVGATGSPTSYTNPLSYTEPTLTNNTNIYSFYAETGITRISTNDTENTSSSTSAPTATYPNTPTSGHLLLCIISTPNATGTTTTPSGWTASALGSMQSAHTNVQSVDVFYKFSAGNEGTVSTTSGSSTGWWMALFEYAGVVNPINVQAHTTNTGLAGATSWTSTAINTAIAGDLVFSVVGQANGNGGSTSWNTSTVLEANTNNYLLMGEYIPTTTLSSWTDTAHWATSRANGGGTLALAPTTQATITTNAVTSITAYTATLNANISALGTASTVSGEGFVLSTTYPNPTYLTPGFANYQVTPSGGTGSFTYNVTGLYPNTTYYVNAYVFTSANPGFLAPTYSYSGISFTTSNASSGQFFPFLAPSNT